MWFSILYEHMKYIDQLTDRELLKMDFALCCLLANVVSGWLLAFILSAELASNIYFPVSILSLWTVYVQQ
jgi:hypothetical protein